MNNDKIIKEIMIKKKALEEQKELKARVEGKLESRMQQLEEKFGCSSIKEAGKRLEEMESDIEKKSGELQIGLEKWEEKYEEHEKNV